MAKQDWFTIWREDRESMLNTMVRNMCSDLECGYDYWGESIVKQREDIERFRTEYDADLRKLADMEPNRVQHWCYMTLIRLGAI